MKNFSLSTPVCVRQYNRFRFGKWETVVLHYRAKWGLKETLFCLITRN